MLLYIIYSYITYITVNKIKFYLKIINYKIMKAHTEE